MRKPLSRCLNVPVPQLARTFDAFESPVVLTDAKRRITWCNAGFSRISGYSLAEVRGRSPGDLLQFAGTDPAVIGAMRAALAAGKGFSGRVLNRSKAGRDYWLALDIQPLRDARGRLEGFVSLQDDVTASVLDYERLRNIVDSAAAGITVMDRSGRVVDCNPEAARLLRVARPDLLGTGAGGAPWQLHAADDTPLPWERQPAARTLLSGEEVQGELVALTFPDGARRWLQVDSRRIAGDVIGAQTVVSSFIDVTEQRAALAALAAERRRLSATLDEAKRREIELEQANAKLQTLFELSPLGIALIGVADGRFLQFNEAMRSMLGYSHAELGALFYRELCPPESTGIAKEQRRRLLASGHYGPFEHELLHRAGHRVTVQTSGVRVALADGTDGIWSIVQDIEPRKRMELQLRSQAQTDRLTGLPNRALLMDRLQQSVARAHREPAHRFALLFLDFDRFKLVNDTLGHDSGDELLRLIANRLRDALRIDGEGDGSEGQEARADAAASSGDLVARFGGDEFVVLLHQVEGADDAARVANRLIRIFALPYLIKQKEIHSSASIGIVLADTTCESAESVLRNADMAMYEAKRAGRGTHAFFDQSMLTRLTRAVRVEEALRRAIALDQLSVVYQPIVNLETGRVSSAEALLRWYHPELGQVSPSEFIPIAEDSGLISSIGDWVLRQACRQWRAWHDAMPERAPATISVNLSRVQMSDGDLLLERVAAVLKECGMRHHQLQLEVTEREVMRDPAGARRLMQGLRAMGVQLAMDDFGTGTSSLGCLRDYPFDVIKIDKSFIDNLAGDADMLAVIHATVSVVENLGMVSVAEGIEDELQVGILQSLGCRFGQGYFFSRPVPGDQLIGAARTPANCTSRVAHV